MTTMNERPIDDSWMRNAACAGEPMRLWFPAQGVVSRKALDICAHCPVQRPCLAHALATGHGLERAVGIWGGTSVKERTKIPRTCARCLTTLTSEIRARLYLARVPRPNWLCPACSPSQISDPMSAHQAAEAWRKHKRRWQPGAGTYSRRWNT